jgi:hypothetical protein
VRESSALYRLLMYFLVFQLQMGQYPGYDRITSSSSPGLDFQSWRRYHTGKVGTLGCGRRPDLREDECDDNNFPMDDVDDDDDDDDDNSPTHSPAELDGRELVDFTSRNQ